MKPVDNPSVIPLPPPIHDGSVSVESAIFRRRSVRTYSAAPLTLLEVSQLLWAAQGITHPEGYRTAASAGALYPLELYLLVGRVTDLGSGVYRYVPRAHQLNAEVLGDRWSELWSTVLAGRRVKESAVVFAVTAACERLAERYGARGERYAHIEVGHVVQNIYLQATAMDLGTVVLGSFADAEVGRIFNCPERERPIALMPVGKPR